MQHHRWLAVAPAVLLSTTALLAIQSGGIPGVGELGGPARVLTPAELQTWLAGRALFDRDFRPSEGLGTPEFNADSCRACHRDPVMGGSGGLELNVSRFGSDHGGAGPFVNVAGGQGLSKLRPPMVRGREQYDPLEADVFEQRQTPTLFGGGLVDAIEDAAILAGEDRTDANRDGIYGIARRIDVAGVIELGRFGWKAQIPHLGDFVKDAMGGECGLTTPDDGRGFALVSDGDAVADPELSRDDVQRITMFLQLLAAPPRGGSSDPRVAQGEALFASIGCAICHVPALPSPNGPVPLYSNLLLHRVMPSGFRGMSEPGAPSGFYKTPPLWGCKDTAPYLHDGRAETLHDAILGHAGEADAVRLAYEAANLFEKEALLMFLGDL